MMYRFKDSSCRLNQRRFERWFGKNMPTTKEREQLAQFLAEADFATEAEKVAWLHTLLDAPPSDPSAPIQRLEVLSQLEELATQQRQLQRKYRLLLVGTLAWVALMLILLVIRLGWLV